MSKRVLIVDDEKIILSSCKKVLLAQGFSVEIAQNADEAIRLLDGDFDLFIVDIKMPFKDGIYLIAELRKRKPHVPIIAMSGYATEETAEESVRAGASSFLSKPFTPEELVETIQNVLREG